MGSIYFTFMWKLENFWKLRASSPWNLSKSYIMPLIGPKTSSQCTKRVMLFRWINKQFILLMFNMIKMALRHRGWKLEGESSLSSLARSWAHNNTAPSLGAGRFNEVTFRLHLAGLSTLTYLVWVSRIDTLSHALTSRSNNLTHQ